MPPTSLAIWLPVLAVLFGFAAHALSTDGGGSVLARLGITKWALPKRAVTPLVVVFGIAASIVEGVQNGLPWRDAAARGVLAALSALFGVVGSQHLTGRDGNGRPLGVITLVGGALLMLVLSGCGFLQKAVPYIPSSDQIACAELEADKGTPAPTVLTKCGFASDALQLVTDLLFGHQKASAVRAAQRSISLDAGADGGADAGADSGTDGGAR